VTVQVDTADITAKAGIDYSATSQILTFAPGATSKTFVVPVIGDRLFEQTENFAVNLSNATGASVSSNFGVGAILDNDPQIFLSVSDATVIEGDSGTSDAIFQVTLSAPCEAAVTVNYATADHTATSGTDYSATSGMLTIPAGQTTGVIRVPVLGDHQAEPYEKFFFLNLSSPAYASLTKTSATATIRDQDSPGTFAFDQASYSVNENAGSKTVVLTVVRTNGGTGAVIIPYTVLSVTATAGQDFQSTSGTVNFADGQISSTISVAIINDSLVETPETFSVTLGTPSISAASLGAIKTTTVTIISEDTAPPPPRINSISTVISKGSMTGINITFSTALDPNTIKNLASYVLSAAGKDKKFGTKDDTKYRITKVAYNATSRTLTLTHSAIRLTADLQLTIIGTGSTALKDTIGQALDGDKNATPGGNAMVMISKTGRATF
jgi:chitinase